MQKISLLLESEAKARETVTLLWDTLGVRGEIEVMPMEGQYKVHVIPERDLTPQQLEKLPGKRT